MRLFPKRITGWIAARSDEKLLALRYGLQMLLPPGFLVFPYRHTETVTVWLHAYNVLCLKGVLSFTGIQAKIAKGNFFARLAEDLCDPARKRLPSRLSAVDDHYPRVRKIIGKAGRK